MVTNQLRAKKRLGVGQELDRMRPYRHHTVEVYY